MEADVVLGIDGPRVRAEDDALIFGVVPDAVVLGAEPDAVSSADADRATGGHPFWVQLPSCHVVDDPLRVLDEHLIRDPANDSRMEAPVFLVCDLYVRLPPRLIPAHMLEAWIPFSHEFIVPEIGSNPATALVAGFGRTVCADQRFPNG